MNGHLDYMRQMDTILVAVGVPTKEVPGASFTLLHPETITEEGEEVSEQTTEEKQVTETPQQAKTEEAVMSKKDAEDLKEVAPTEDVADGWDIPDISDLLDSLNDAESESQTEGKNCETAVKDDTASDLNARVDAEEDPDNEHISWSWDDTHWTTEHTHIQRQPDS